jgi:hypothetical protein
MMSGSKALIFVVKESFATFLIGKRLSNRGFQKTLTLRQLLKQQT